MGVCQRSTIFTQENRYNRRQSANRKSQFSIGVWRSWQGGEAVVIDSSLVSGCVFDGQSADESVAALSGQCGVEAAWKEE